MGGGAGEEEEAYVEDPFAEEFEEAGGEGEGGQVREVGDGLKVGEEEAIAAAPVTDDVATTASEAEAEKTLEEAQEEETSEGQQVEQQEEKGKDSVDLMSNAAAIARRYFAQQRHTIVPSPIVPALSATHVPEHVGSGAADPMAAPAEPTGPDMIDLTADEEPGPKPEPEPEPITGNETEAEEEEEEDVVERRSGEIVDLMEESEEAAAAEVENGNGNGNAGSATRAKLAALGSNTAAATSQAVSAVARGLSGLWVQMASTDVAKAATESTVETSRLVYDSLRKAGDSVVTQYIMADDPEVKHFQVEQQNMHAQGWKGINKFYNSLSWYERQLIPETRQIEFTPSAEPGPSVSTPVAVAAACLPLGAISDDDDDDESAGVDGREESDGSGGEEEHEQEQETGTGTEAKGVDKTVGSADIPSPPMPIRDRSTPSLSAQDLAVLTPAQRANYDDLIERAERGDEEAQFALAREFAPPGFQQKTHCAACRKPFGMRRRRHHCRHCGQSYCHRHSNHFMAIRKLGDNRETRVCDTCNRILRAEALSDRWLWRDSRVLSYLSSRRTLIPYFEHAVDRGVDRAYRCVEGAIYLAKVTPLSATARLAVGTVDILRRYGMAGIAGVLLRNDFVQAVEALRRITGIEEAWPMSVHEMTATIYYLLAKRRAARGDAPFAEEEAHGEVHGCHPVANSELDTIRRYAPIALHFAYDVNPVQVQLLCNMQGWQLIVANTDSEPEKPAFVLLASQTRKEIVLAVRGTQTIQDVVTDIRAVPVPFPPPELDDVAREQSAWLERTAWLTESEEEEEEQGEGVDADAATTVGRGPVPVPLRSGVSGGAQSDRATSQGSYGSGSSGGSGATSGSAGFDWLSVDVTRSYACGGMARAATYIYREIAPAVLRLHRAGFRVVITGHSLGGAVASLLSVLFRPIVPDLRAYTFSTPSCMDLSLASQLTDTVTTVILHDDVVPRITPRSIRFLMHELQREQRLVNHLYEDWQAMVRRAMGFWAPKFRNNVTLKKAAAGAEGAETVAEEVGFDEMAAAQLEAAEQEREEAKATAEAKAEAEMNDAAEEGKAGDDRHPESRGHKDDNDNADNEEEEEVEVDDGVVVMVEEERLPDLYIPGRLLHIYSVCGVYKVEAVPRDFAGLTRIPLQGNIFTDHAAVAMFDALCEVADVRRAPESPAPWVPYSASSSCQACGAEFSWSSTFTNEPQKQRDKHNCRNCGALVCGPCSSRKRALPSIGLNFECRVCDKCFFRGVTSQVGGGGGL